MDRILKALARLEPRAQKTLPLRIKGDHLLMGTLKSGGLRAVERLVKTLNARGHRFEPVDGGAGRRWWREEHDGRAFEIRVWSSRALKMAALHYLRPKKQKLTRAQLELQAEQKRFYDRCMEVGQKAYRDPRYRLSAMDRRLFLVGELEADVAALKSIGAAKTATMLLSAMAPSMTEAKLAVLDGRFYKVAEDLAVLGARHARLK